jgi:hypothetical protein
VLDASGHSIDAVAQGAATKGQNSSNALKKNIVWASQDAEKALFTGVPVEAEGEQL